MAENLKRQVAIVVDDAEKVLRSILSRSSMERAAKNGTVFTPATSVNIASSEKGKLREILCNLNSPIGLHAVLDEDSITSNLYSHTPPSIFGHNGLLHRQREAYEDGKEYIFGLVGQALTDYIILALQQQVKLFQEIFRLQPGHLSYHNGWGFSIEATNALMTVAEANDIPVRMSRHWFTEVVARIPYSPLETGYVIDSHNIPHLSPPTERDDFVTHVNDSLSAKNLPSAEVLMHVHGDDHSFYEHHGAVLANSRTQKTFLDQGITLVTPRQLISH